MSLTQERYATPRGDAEILRGGKYGARPRWVAGLLLVSVGILLMVPAAEAVAWNV